VQLTKGHKKSSYDLWANAVNTASRMGSTSKSGRVQVCWVLE